MTKTLPICTESVLDASDRWNRYPFGDEIRDWLRAEYGMWWAFRIEAFIADGVPALKVEWWGEDIMSMVVDRDGTIHPHIDIVPVRELPASWRPASLAA
jgi:hypothetical protein